MKREFYLQNSCSYLGNSMLWWAKKGGYTTDLCEARVFTLDNAQAQHNARHTDIPWPVEYIHPTSRLVVDRQDVRVGRVRDAGIILRLDQIPPTALARERRHAPENPVEEGDQLPG